MNVQLEKIDHLLRLNKLLLNVDKTHYMNFTNSPQHYLSIEIRNIPLIKVTASKFLGVIIDSPLSFKAHVYKLCKRVSSAIGALKRVRFFIHKSIVKTL